MSRASFDGITPLLLTRFVVASFPSSGPEGYDAKDKLISFFLTTMSDTLTIAGKPYQSRLLVGTGKYKDFEQTRQALDASGAEIVTVAIRRTNLGQDSSQPSLLDFVPPST